MAYTITLTDGTLFATVADGTVNTSSSVTLIGKNYAGYGDFLDENFIHMLENFSNTSAPAARSTARAKLARSAMAKSGATGGPGAGSPLIAAIRHARPGGTSQDDRSSDPPD